MGPPASVCFILSGIALLLLQKSGAQKPPKRDISTPLAATVAFIALIPTLGYLYGATELYGIARYTGISLHSAITFIILSVGIIFAIPFSPTVSLITAPTAGGVLVRRLLFPAMLLPPVMGYLRTLAEHPGRY